VRMAVFVYFSVIAVVFLTKGLDAAMPDPVTK
jgi:hypothetical protein